MSLEVTMLTEIRDNKTNTGRFYLGELPSRVRFPETEGAMGGGGKFSIEFVWEDGKVLEVEGRDG